MAEVGRPQGADTPLQDVLQRLEAVLRGMPPQTRDAGAVEQLAEQINSLAAVRARDGWRAHSPQPACGHHLDAPGDDTWCTRPPGDHGTSREDPHRDASGCEWWTGRVSVIAPQPAPTNPGFVGDQRVIPLPALRAIAGGEPLGEVAADYGVPLGVVREVAELCGLGEDERRHWHACTPGTVDPACAWCNEPDGEETP